MNNYETGFADAVKCCLKVCADYFEDAGSKCSNPKVIFEISSIRELANRIASVPMPEMTKTSPP